MSEKVTAGRDYLGAFAPQFAAMNDDVLFGQVWSREKELAPRDRSLITVAALMGAGITDTSMKGHLEKAKENGVTKEEIVEVITQLASIRAGRRAGRYLRWRWKSIKKIRRCRNETKIRCYDGGADLIRSA